MNDSPPRSTPRAHRQSIRLLGAPVPVFFGLSAKKKGLSADSNSDEASDGVDALQRSSDEQDHHPGLIRRLWRSEAK